VIAEMFGGGASLFDLSSLLEYRNGENLPSLPEYIKKIEDKGIRVSTGCDVLLVINSAIVHFIRSPH